MMMQSTNVWISDPGHSGTFSGCSQINFESRVITDIKRWAQIHWEHLKINNNWTKALKEGTFTQIVSTGNHWYFVIINITKATTTVYDSSNNSDTNSDTNSDNDLNKMQQKLEYFIACVFEEHVKNESHLQLNGYVKQLTAIETKEDLYMKWKTVTKLCKKQNYHQQPDGNSCGIMTVLGIGCAHFGVPFFLKEQIDIKSMRQKIVRYIFSSEEERSSSLQNRNTATTDQLNMVVESDDTQN